MVWEWEIENHNAFHTYQSHQMTQSSDLFRPLFGHSPFMPYSTLGTTYTYLSPK